MFKYWQSYEIDGSDTAFDLVLPNENLVKELVEYYFSLPLWDKDAGMSLNISKKNDCWASHRDVETLAEKFDIDKALARLAEEKYSCAYIILRCLQPDFLPARLRKEIYALSAGRPGLKKQKQPVAPNSGLYGYGFDDCLNVGLLLVCAKPDDTARKEAKSGLIHNLEAIERNLQLDDAISAQIHCGPSFFYEYAAYLVENIARRFPEIGVYGGLDCAGGFVEGCTYSSDFYAYEVFTFSNCLPQTLLEQLLAKNILYPVSLGKEKNYRQNFCNDGKQLCLINHDALAELTGQAVYNVAIKNYESFVEKIDENKQSTRQAQYLGAVCVSLVADEQPEAGSFAHLTAYVEAGRWKMQLYVPSAHRQLIEKRLQENNISYK